LLRRWIFKSPQIKGAVRINPEVWTSYDSISAVLPEPAGSYSRADLKKLVSHAFSENDRHLISELFVKTMMWGSGITNGRGPRNTSKALVAGKPVEVLIKVRELLLSSQISQAYDLHREIPGVGPSFHTKLLWVVGSDIPYLKPRPLILDDLVWKGLKAIGWSSVKAAGTIRRGKRYVAYLEACEQWASEEDWQPEDVEYSLYLLGNKS
jgi:hypothetical protein